MSDGPGEDEEPARPLVKKRRANRRRALQEAERQIPINFAIVGVQKAATSSLYVMLTKHPAVARGPEKEMRLFIRERLNWEQPKFKRYARASDDPRETLAGDATPVYFFWPRAIERMSGYDPALRLIVNLRDPIERAFSQWSMERAWNPDFPELPEAIDRFAAGTIPDSIPDGMTPAQLRKESLFTRGLYGQQLRRGLRFFPREQWLVLDFHHVFARQSETLDRVTDFLGVDRFTSYPPVVHRNQTPSDHEGEPPSVEQVARLVDLYAPDLRELHDLSGLDVSGWTTSRVAAGELSVEEFTEQLNRKLGLTSTR